MIYQWKDGAHKAKLDAQQVGERLAFLREAHHGITAEVIVEDARPAKAVLHQAFEWRDKVAAEEYRKVQARELVRSVTTYRIDGDPESGVTRAFVMVGEREDRAYQPVRVVMGDPVMRAELLRQALRELRAWQAKYRELEELAAIFEAMESVAAAAEVVETGELVPV